MIGRGKKEPAWRPLKTIMYKSYRSTWDELAELEVELKFVYILANAVS